MQESLCPCPCYADVEISGMLSFRESSGMWRKERDRQNWQNANYLQVLEWKWNEWQMRCFFLIEIQWQKWPKLFEAGCQLLEVEPCLISLLLSFHFPVKSLFFLPYFHSQVASLSFTPPPSLRLFTGIVFQNQISKSSFFKTQHGVFCIRVVTVATGWKFIPLLCCMNLT